MSYIKEFEAEVKAYQAETQRISAVQASMTPEQIQDIVMGTIAAAVDTGDLVAGMPEMRETPARPARIKTAGRLAGHRFPAAG